MKPLLKLLTILLLSGLGATLVLSQSDDTPDGDDIVNNMCDIRVANDGWGARCAEADSEAKRNFRWRLGWWIYRVEYEDYPPCEIPEIFRPDFCDIEPPTTPNNQPPLGDIPDFPDFPDFPDIPS